MKLLLPGLALMLALASFAAPPQGAQQTSWRFDFGPRDTPGYISVMPNTSYNAQRGYGFEGGGAVHMRESNWGPDEPNTLLRDYATSEKPFLFSVALPEGNYKVSVLLGSANEISDTTVKAEARRLMLQDVSTKAGAWKTRSFLVNVRTPGIKDGRSVGINKREYGALNWDDKLTLEFNSSFNGARPSACALEIKKVEDAITMYIAGDSTVTDQANEPFAAWGQMLPRFFSEAVAVANHAESGRALYSFKSERRLEKILSTIKPGDYLFVQFGHNDQKDKSPGSGPFTSYKENLKFYIAQARNKGAHPVVITPMERRRWDGEKPLQTLSDFAEAARQTAKEENVPLIDLHAMSLQFYAALGPEKSLKAFVHYPANTFPGQIEPLKDDTHFNAYGGYQLARCVVEGIKTNVPQLARFLADDVASFDASKPDDITKWHLPSSPFKITQTPEGS
jgi:lysophospholipase L1-like esterase